MITQELVRHLFDYKDGNLIWKINKTDKIKCGFVAGSLNSSGYINIGIDKKLYLAHRLVFLWHCGYVPDFLDHINHVTTDNRIENLRPATHSENMRNRKVSKNNASGVTGVSWCKFKNRWEARIVTGKKNKRLGYFKTLEDAVSARRNAEKIYYADFAPPLS